MDEIEIERRLTEVEARSKSNTHQLEEVKRRQNNIDELVQSVATLANEQGHMKDDIGEIKTDLKSIVQKPGKNWDKLVDMAIAAVVGAFLAWIAAGTPGL